MPGARSPSGEGMGSIGEQARKVGGSITDAAGSVAEKAKAAVGDVGENLTGAASKFADSQKASGTKIIQNVSEAAQAGAEKLEAQSPMMAGYVRDASQQLDRFADDFQNRSIGDLMQDVSNFARRQPAIFIAGSVLAGFVLTRFLKSSSPEDGRQHFAGPSGSRRWDQDDRGDDYVG